MTDWIVKSKYTSELAQGIKSQLPNLIISSFILVASLSWNTAIQDLIDNYIPKEYSGKKNAWFKILYSFILSLVIIIIIVVLTEFGHKIEAFFKI